MSEREKLLNRLSAAQFAAWEIHIYLDTHPNDAAAIDAYNKYRQKFSQLMQEFSEKYGAVCADKSENAEYWDWIDAPWPWELTDGSDK